MKQLRNEQGYALAIAVLVITVLSILGISLMATTGNSKKMANKEQENQAAYYIAEAGMNLKKAEIKKAADLFRKDTAGWKDSKLEEALKQPPKINLSTTYNSKNSNGTDKVFDTNNASAKVTVEYTTKPGAKTTTDNQTKAVQNYIYKIKSVGMIDNQKRTITSTMSYDLTVNSEEQKPEVKPDENKGGSKYVVHAMDEIDVDTITINGLVGFKKKEPLPTISPFRTKNNNSSLIGANSGKKYINNDQYTYKTPVNNKDIILGDSNIPKVPEFPINDFKNYQIEYNSITTSFINELPKYTNNDNIKSGSYSITRNDLIEGINTHNKNLSLFLVNQGTLDSLNSSGSTNFNISGNGNVKFFANSIELNNTSKFIIDSNINFYLQNLKITDNSSLQSRNNINIISKNLNFTSRGNIISDGILNFYNSDSFHGSDFIKITSTKTTFYYTGSNTLTLQNGIYYKMDIFSLNNCVTVNSGRFSGDMYIYKNSSCTIRDATIKTTNHIFAPFTTITLGDNVNFTGSLIVNKLIRTSGGKATLTYSPPEIGVMPDPPPPGNNGSNNGDSIIIDSSFSDAIDSGTVEIDNDR